ncbi:MAG: hypothetical protein KF768_07535 [Phycisphaeraceae bacterium]|nr:hypothetical protein [Phycisphaeraceae bacterium]
MRLFTTACVGLLGLAAAAQAQPKVAIVAAAATSATSNDYLDVQSKLNATGLFSQVDILHITTPVPTPQLGQLMPYDAIIVWSNQSFADSTALGNTLADYSDLGKGVVLSVFAITSTTANRFLTGRWKDQNYGIIVPEGGNTGGTHMLGSILVPDHPIMNNVNSLANNLSSRPTTTAINAGGVVVSEWSDGKILVATSTTHPRRVDLGLYPPSSDSGGSRWLSTTDGAILMANALVYASAGAGGSFPPSLVASLDSSLVVAGNDVVISAEVLPGTVPASTGITVTADLTVFGGSPTQALTLVSGNEYAYTLSIPALQPADTYNITLTVSDDQMRSTSGSVAMLVIPPPPPGYTYEIEPNESKTNATPATIDVGGGVYGITTGSSVLTDGSLITPDYFLLTLTPKPQLGIYRHTMTLETDGTAGHSATLRGHSQGSGGINLASDTATQTSVATTFPPRTNAWYGFGRAEQMFYRVIGSTSTTSPYRATLSTEEILPIDLGVGQELSAGQITISRFGHTNTIDLLVYDGNFEAFEDCVVDGAGTMIRTFPAGTYYLAVSNVNTCDERPFGPGSTTLTSPVLHFPGSVSNSSTVGVGNLSLQFDDGLNNFSVFAFKDIFFGVAWIKFVVVGGECPGDYNDDGVVDLGDLLDFLGDWNPNLGQSVTPGTNGDVNNDGVVDLADLLDFLADWNPNLGSTCS